MDRSILVAVIYMGCICCMWACWWVVWVRIGGGRVKCESLSVSWLGEVRMSVCVCMFVCSDPTLAAEYSTASGGESCTSARISSTLSLFNSPRPAKIH